MAVNILFLSCVAMASVRGQFLDAEYRLDSVPLPIRRRMDSSRFEVQPSTGQEIVSEDVSTDTTGVTQGRRHIDNNGNSNGDNEQIVRNLNIFEVKPYENIYLTDDRNYETKIADRRTNDEVRSQKYYEDQNSFQVQQQNLEYNQEGGIHKIYKNAEQLSQIQTHKGDNRLRTNLDNKQGSSDQSNLRSQENVPSIQNVNYNESILNQQKKSSEVSENQNKSNENSRSNGYNESQNNSNKRTEASQRAIDSNPYRNQQNVDSSNYNNRNYNAKPNRQNTETRKEENNRHRNIQTTEPTRRYTTLHITVTGGTKSTEDNELVSNIYSEGRSEDNEDRWIWMSGSNTTSERNKNTTVEPTLPTVDDRAAFAGDKCPTGQVRYNNRCVDED